MCVRVCVCLCVCVCVCTCVCVCPVTQSYSTLCDPVDCSSTGSSIQETFHGKNTGVGCHFLLQGIYPRTLEWAATSFSRGSTQEHWSGLPLPSPGDLPKNTGVGCHFLLQGIYPTRDQTRVSVPPALVGGFFTTSATWKWTSLIRVRLFVTPWTLQCMEFSRPEYWSGEPFPSPADLPNPGDWTQVSCIAGGFFTSWSTREVLIKTWKSNKQLLTWMGTIKIWCKTYLMYG